MLKNCYVCKQRKPLTEFYFSSGVGKHNSQCKLCQNRRRDKEIRGLPQEQRRRLWRRATQNAIERHPLHFEARRLVAKALKDGILVRMPCEVCSDTETQAHHEDYAKPLEVSWLCHTHHRARHYTNTYKPEEKTL